MGAREYRVAMRPEGRGFLMYTLRAADEVRTAEPYFEDVGDGELNKSEQKLAEDLLKSMEAPLATAEFKDRYQEGLLNIIKSKSEGHEPVFAPPVEDKSTMNFLAALEQSLKSAKQKAAAPARKKPAAKSIKKPAAASARKRKKA
jgi:DNA end-binding protein Ku